MPHRTRSFVVAVLALALALGVSACGHKQSTIVKGDTEGPFVDAGPLQYQVQISRQLNPYDVEDRAYLQGVPTADRALAPNQTWFAVFVAAFNDGKHDQPSAEDFFIEDTLKQEFHPIVLAASNPFAYRPGIVPSRGGRLPNIDSAAGTGPTGGGLLLFKLDFASLANRPLELHITSPVVPQKEATIDLDV